jgi:sugar phosphate isomerase/epimerase
MNNFPKLHNATWPGIVGKGPDSEPIVSFEEMINYTANAEVNGVKFDGLDLGLFGPHIDLNTFTDDDTKHLAEKVQKLNLEIGSLVAPIWGGPAMGTAEQRKAFVEEVRKSCAFGQRLRELGVRPNGVVRIDSASSVGDWAKDPAANTKLIAQTFREACDVAADFNEKLAAEGEICWGGMHSWRAMLDTLEMVDRKNIGFQADMSHTFLYMMGFNSPENRILPEGVDLADREAVTAGLKTLTAALRPWTLDFHVAQNDGTAYGEGSHEKTGRHCQANDPNGKLNIPIDAGHWLRDEAGNLTKAFKHICWDGCMFPNSVMRNQQTWNDILSKMIQVRNKHGWVE